MPPPHKKSFAAEQLALRQKNKVSPVIWVLVGVFVVALIAGGYVIYQNSAVKEEAETEQIKWIAVLPFADMSLEKDQEYLGDGIADEIINDLSHVEGLSVIDRTSSFEYKGKENAIDEISEKLNVQYVLEGSVKKAGKMLRITAQLINVDDHSHLFSKEYDREYNVDDILAIENEISQAIVEHLKITLLETEKTAITRRSTDDTEAWELYMLGRHAMDSLNKGKAADYFRQLRSLEFRETGSSRKSS